MRPQTRSPVTFGSAHGASRNSGDGDGAPIARGTEARVSSTARDPRARSRPSRAMPVVGLSLEHAGASAQVDERAFRRHRVRSGPRAGVDRGGPSGRLAALLTFRTGAALSCSRPEPPSTRFPYSPLFRSRVAQFG